MSYLLAALQRVHALAKANPRAQQKASRETGTKPFQALAPRRSLPIGGAGGGPTVGMAPHRGVALRPHKPIAVGV